MTEDEAIDVARAQAAKDMRLQDATFVRAELGTDWVATDIGEDGVVNKGKYVLALIVWFDGAGDAPIRRHFAVDAIDGEVLNPGIAPVGSRETTYRFRRT